MYVKIIWQAKGGTFSWDTVYIAEMKVSTFYYYLGRFLGRLQGVDLITLEGVWNVLQ